MYKIKKTELKIRQRALYSILKGHDLLDTQIMDTDIELDQGDSFYVRLPNGHWNIQKQCLKPVITEKFDISSNIFTKSGQPVTDAKITNGKITGILNENQEIWNIDGSYYLGSKSDFDLTK